MSVIGSAAFSAAYADDQEDLRLEELNEVVVQAVKAPKDAPFAKANLDKEELSEFSTSGKELPMLFSRTPGVVAWGENGLGTGTVYMRIRGAADSRINVTLDGVPLNSPEDQCVFWANMNSYASLLGNVQIQRGVGTSTNGDGAFGGTIALTSKAPSTNPTAEISGSLGSYNTFNIGGSFSTGLMKNHFILDGAYHETNTDGYMHGTSGRSGSYYGGLTWMGSKTVVRLKHFGNFEKTGQAWNGATTGDDDNSMLTAIDWTDSSVHERVNGYKGMYNHGLGKYNSLYEHLIPTDNGDWEKDANGNYITERYQMRDGSYWDKTTDNFWQNRTILSLACKINDHWNTTASVHYTHGYGYYSEFRPENKFSKFGIVMTQELADQFGLKFKKGESKTDFVRKKGLTQNHFGFIWNANYKDDKWDVISGISIQDFYGNHFGYLTYIANAAADAYYRPDGIDYKYYNSDAEKLDGNLFAKATLHMTDHWDAFADVQYRFVSYLIDGYNDRYYYDDNGVLQKHNLDICKNYNFFNPKAGLSWHKGGNFAYASFAMSNREPERNNFTDNGYYPAPRAERLYDTEVGYNFTGKTWMVGANLYYMNYKDQFVKTGMKSDIGEDLTTNIDKSYRAGVELTAAWNITRWLTIEGNAALSSNKIKDFTEVVDNWEGDPVEVHYDDSELAMSPSTILNGFVDFHVNGFKAVWHTNYVSKQYLDNTKCDARSLPCYSTSDLSLSYTWNFRKGVKALIIGANVNNIFNRHYAASGWVYSALEEYAGLGDPSNRYNQIGYIPQAGTTSMASLTLRF